MPKIKKRSTGRGHGGGQSKSPEVIARSKLIGALVLEGHTLASSASVANCTINQAAWALKTAEKRWQEEATESIDAMKRKELDRIEHQEQIAWSKLKIIEEKSRESEDIDQFRKLIETQASILADIRHYSDQRVKLFGLSSPAKVEISKVADVDDASEYERLRQIPEAQEHIKALARLALEKSRAD